MTTETGRAAGLDLGWRVREDGLRVGYLTDDSGHRYELLLPFVFGNSNARRRERYERERGFTPWDTTDWRALAELQAAEDALIEDCKARLALVEEADRVGWPEATRRRFTILQKVRSAGLRRAFRELSEAGVTGDTVQILTEWQGKADVMRKRIRVAQLKSADKRRDSYRKLADWLSRNFDQLVWEGDFNLKGLAEAPGGDYARKNSRRYRFVASLHTLRLYIEQSFAKRGRALVNCGAAYSSRVCPQCGCRIEPSPGLLVECENGHRGDQDALTSRLLLSTLGVQAGGAETPAAIPRDLERCVRVVERNSW
ncbi:MAG TPA: hypothetical protein VFD58_02860 [Blastocatellia bacterium]|nr:hypothetical protein [Blastocatellia bacterium]